MEERVDRALSTTVLAVVSIGNGWVFIEYWSTLKWRQNWGCVWGLKWMHDSEGIVGIPSLGASLSVLHCLQ